MEREKERELTPETRDIHGRASTRDSDDFITLAMKPIYQETVKIKGGRGAPKRRADHIEAAVTKRNGIWIEVHDAIDVAFDALFGKVEDAMVTRFGEVFDSLHNNFKLLCADSEAKRVRRRKCWRLSYGTTSRRSRCRSRPCWLRAETLRSWLLRARLISLLRLAPASRCLCLSDELVHAVR